MVSSNATLLWQSKSSREGRLTKSLQRFIIGRTPHNNLGLFTGWEDPPLAPDGVEDAKNAGRLLKMHGFEFDVVYTSWLQRAIETACKYRTIGFTRVSYPLLSSHSSTCRGVFI